MTAINNSTTNNNHVEKYETLSYNIMSLDPEILLSERKIVKDKNSENYKIEYLYDFRSMAFSKKQLISSIDTYYSNALFFQIDKLISNPTDKHNDDLLLRNIVFIDFTEIFKRFKDKNACKETTYSKKDLEDAPADVLLCQLFDPDNGFTIIFEDGESVRFVPFDKSGSMSRECRTSFINSRIKADLDHRLLLGMDSYFNSNLGGAENAIQLIPSKYYAYRGLYLSDAQRIEASEQLVFNQETVIVVDDDMNNVVQQAVGKNKERTPLRFFGDSTSGQVDRNGVFWRLSEFEKDSEIINVFDGEGIISPEYSELINVQLGKNDASSYQIRMPFAKGMLHRVDYNAFITEYISESECLFIKDYFGIDRDIRKAKIILTKSMLKCCDWLKKITKIRNSSFENETDPMKDYFDGMVDFDHALYVGNTSSVLSTSDRTKMNYQFLNTLDINADEIDNIVNSHVEQINNVKADMLSAWESDNDLDMSGEENMNISAPWIGVLKKNSDFISNPKIKNLIEGTQESLVRDCGLGKLNVYGECRFFSCDLLSFLVYLSKKIVSKNGLTASDELKSIKCLFADRFYMPKPSIHLYSKKQYAFFRSPHLSRNEQCILRPYIPSSEKDIYDRYFSHLSGIVMVSRNSMAPMILSGADFDGDLVKVVAEQDIVTSVMRGGYRDNQNEYIRLLPIVNIPNTKELAPPEYDNGSIPYKTIKNTFSNQIGLISNLAIVAGKKEYFEKNSEYSNLCAACTVVTGLEIDAAKTGVHPTQNIKLIQEKLKQARENDDDNTSAKSEPNKKQKKKRKTGDYFLDANKAIAALPRNRKLSVKASQDNPAEMKVFVSSEKEPKLTVQYYGTDDLNVATIDRLPGYFAKTKYNELEKQKQKKSEQKGQKVAKRTKRILFEFESNDAAWKKSLDTQKVTRTSDLIHAYLKTINYNRDIAKIKQKYSNANFANCAFNILKIQYDSLDILLPPELTGEASNCTPRQALDRAYAFLEDHFDNGIQVNIALNKMIEDKWHLSSRDCREDSFRNIIQLEKSIIIPDEVLSIVTNFSNGGYRLLYYILNDILSKDFKGMTPEKMEEYTTHSISTTADDTEATSDSIIFTKLYNEYCKYANKNGTKKLWQKALVKICREELKSIFDIKENASIASDKNWDEALMTVHSLQNKEDKNYTFFWDVLPGDVIIRNVLTKEEEGEENVK